ncbi:MAG: alpha/beta hydrolase, partial [Rhodocyclaceae bacterium]|nr:alpha/beta hydrolase [Rhodocyclaceae bacterium]
MNAILARWRLLLSCLAISVLGSVTAVSAQTEAVQEIVKLKTRGDVEQAYLLLHEKTQPEVVAVLFTGGFGLLKLRATDAGVIWEKAGISFLVINQDRFRDGTTAVAVVDVPTDQWGMGYTPKFRKSEAHATDVRHIVKDLRARYPQTRIFLVGTSQGATSAAYVGKALGKEVDGVVLTAAVFEWAPAAWQSLHDSNLSDFDFAQISVPLLIVHHVDDRCVATPFAAAAKFIGKYPFITVRGGEPVRD